MDHLRTRLSRYTPARVEEITGVGERTQAKLVELLVKSPRILIYATWGSNKTHHADLLQRSLILLSALRGQHGRRASGVRFAAWLPLEGADQFLVRGQPSWFMRQVLRFVTPPPRTMEKAIRDATPSLGWTPSHLFLYVHGGLADEERTGRRDPQLKRPLGDYFDEALERGWRTVRPAADRPPRVLVVSGCNPLRRWPQPDVVESVLWPKLRTIAVIDPLLSTTGMKADLVLPAASYYEKRGIKYAVAVAPYIVQFSSSASSEQRQPWPSRKRRRLKKRFLFQVLKRLPLRNESPIKEMTSVKIEKILLILSLIFMMSIVSASFGIAFAGGIRGAGLLGACFFLTFGIIIVLAQVIPAGILVSSLVGAMASPSRKNEVPVEVV